MTRFADVITFRTHNGNEIFAGVVFFIAMLIGLILIILAVYLIVLLVRYDRRDKEARRNARRNFLNNSSKYCEKCNQDYKEYIHEEIRDLEDDFENIRSKYRIIDHKKSTEYFTSILLDIKKITTIKERVRGQIDNGFTIKNQVMERIEAFEKEIQRIKNEIIEIMKSMGIGSVRDEIDVKHKDTVEIYDTDYLEAIEELEEAIGDEDIKEAVMQDIQITDCRRLENTRKRE